MSFKNAPGCGCCDPCATFCSNGAAPTIDVEFPAADNELFCSDCADFAGTYTLSVNNSDTDVVNYKDLLTPGETIDCYWALKTADPTGCRFSGGPNIIILLALISTNLLLYCDWFGTGSLATPSSGDFTTWKNAKDCTANIQLTNPAKSVTTDSRCSFFGSSTFEVNP